MLHAKVLYMVHTSTYSGFNMIDTMSLQGPTKSRDPIEINNIVTLASNKLDNNASPSQTSLCI